MGNLVLKTLKFLMTIPLAKLISRLLIRILAFLFRYFVYGDIYIVGREFLTNIGTGLSYF